MTTDKTSDIGYVDLPLLLSVLALLIFSVAFVYSASSAYADMKFHSSEYLFWLHAIRVLIGIAVIFVFARIDYRKWKKLTKPAMFAAIACLMIVLVVGTRIKGASRWIHFGPVNFQPSEFAKFALVFHLAALMAAKKETIKDFSKTFVPVMIWVAAVVGLVAIQPNLSTALTIFFISAAMLCIGNINRIHLALTSLGGIVIAAGYAVTASYRMQRIETFLGMQSAQQSEFGQRAAYQVQQALIAFGNGGFWGVGPGQSHQRELFLPESYGDFIYSIIGEEYGYIGAIAILACFALIAIRGIKIAKHAPDDFGRYVAFGVTVTVCLYAFFNAAVTCGLVPTTGLPMPFISYGGSSVLFTAAAVGILLNISAHTGLHPKHHRAAKRVEVATLDMDEEYALQWPNRA
ncbi:MAG TPA: putative lipid II flippase FtsW [Candidatus Kapabacteria bacterium]|nr:putative lipid II flippase FtsW [Candidatus Kapabacteria bacterium]